MQERTRSCAGLVAALLLISPLGALGAPPPPVVRITKAPAPDAPVGLKPAPVAIAASRVPFVPPTITSVRALTSPNSPSVIVRAGDTIVVKGTGLDGINTTLTINFATNTGTAAQPNWVVNTAALRTFSATATDVTASEFRFAVPDVPPTIALVASMVVTVAKGKASVTSKDVIQVGQKPTERKIVSVEQTAVRAGGRIKIHGLDIDDVPGLGGYSGVTVGYFGVGTPGSVSNPAISVANRGATYVELWLSQTCNQHGILMLSAPVPAVIPLS